MKVIDITKNRNLIIKIKINLISLTHQINHHLFKKEDKVVMINSLYLQIYLFNSKQEVSNSIMMLNSF